MRIFAACFTLVLLSGCATQLPSGSPIFDPPNPSLPPIPPRPPVPPPVVVTPPSSPFPTYPTEAAARAAVSRLLPSTVKDKAGWTQDIVTAFTALNLPYRTDQFCAAMAVIEQESTWQADPTVPGLGDIVWKKIAEKAGGLVPMPALRLALSKNSVTGESYTSRIDRLRSEKEMNTLFEDMSADAQRLGLPVAMKNPIRTGGPMQVSVTFAEELIRAKPYPYPRKGSVRSEVFSRKGGLYFGIAHLLDFPADYTAMRYRFADFNAGPYASRNAAVQQVVARLSGRALVSDGDLLIYRDGAPSGAPSSSQLALNDLAARLGLSAAEIQRDIRQEKMASFSRTVLYQRLFALADRQAGRAVPREAMPQITLNSPKIVRKLTTEWFANRVNGRYEACLARDGVRH
jgi:hypothetical protein